MTTYYERNLADAAERFKHDIRDHQMTVLRDDGLYRHLRFKRPKEGAYWFDIVTWPWNVAMTGDMGANVFSRIEDMFEFFRNPEGRINPGYWHQKLSAQDIQGTKSFEPDLFVEHVRDYLDGAEASQEVRDEVEREVVSCQHDGEFFAMQAAMGFEHDGFRFEDFYEHDSKAYTLHFLWGLHAIVWAINQYDAFKGRPRELCGDCAEWVRPRPDGTLPPHPSGGLPAECQETLSVLGSGDPDRWPDHPDKPSQHHDPDGPRDDPGRGMSQGPPASGSTQGQANQESEVTS